MSSPVVVNLVGFAAGNDVDVNLTIPNVNTADALVTGKLMVKAKYTDLDVAAICSLAISTSPAAAGQITDDGHVTGTALAVFTLPASVTISFVDPTTFKSLPLVWDCKFYTVAGKKYTPAHGTIGFAPPVVQA